MNRFRECICKDIAEGIGNEKNVAVFLSGGIDSTSCLLACIDLGLNITAYTFYLEGHESQDLHASRAISNKINVPLKEIVVPYSINKLQEDTIRIIKEFKTARKTAVQCIHPFLYIIPEVKENTIVSGLYADDLYGTSRKGNIIGRKNKREFDIFRLHSLSQENYSCVYIRKAVEKSGKKLVTPFKGGALQEYLMGLSWEQMNTPVAKYIAVSAFNDYYGRNAWYRKNSNLQVNSGIREYHELLLKTPLNKRNSENVVGIYNDILRGVK